MIALDNLYFGLFSQVILTYRYVNTFYFISLNKTFRYHNQLFSMANKKEYKQPSCSAPLSRFEKN